MPNQVTVRDRLRYRFDNLMGRGVPAMMLVLFAIGVLMAMLIALIVSAAGLAPGKPSTGDTTDRALLDSLDVGSYDQVVTLHSDKLDAQAADARTLITLLHLRDMARKHGHRYSIVSEMLLRPASDYVALGTPINFYTVVEAAARRGEVAVGIREAASAGDRRRAYGVIVNPSKQQQFSYAEGDRILVLADS